MNSKFLKPPQVEQPSIVGKFTPLDADTIEKMANVLDAKSSGESSAKRKAVQWNSEETKLLIERYKQQGEYIPELRLPDSPNLDGLFRGRFTPTQIKTKAKELGLAGKIPGSHKR